MTRRKIEMVMLILFLALVGALPAMAGSAVIGSVAGSKDATVGGQTLLPDTTLFSGDQLQVKDGVAVVAMERGSRMVFGRETVASFERQVGGVTVVLGQGNLSLYHPVAGLGMRVKVGEVAVVPGAGYATLGEVALLGGTLVVTAQEGTLRIEGKGPAMEVTKGKTVTLKVGGSAAPANPPAAGAPTSNVTLGEVAAVGGAAAGGVSTGFSIAAKNKASDAQATAALADADAKAAAAAAAAEAAAASAACKAASPTAPCP